MPGKPPSSADHLKKAEDNKRFGQSLNTAIPTSAGWALIAFFYSALHFAEAYFIKISVRNASHGERTDYIKSHSELKPIYPRYRQLSDYGYNARYNFNVYGQEDIDEALPSLDAVERFFRSLL